MMAVSSVEAYTGTGWTHTHAAHAHGHGVRAERTACDWRLVSNKLQVLRCRENGLSWSCKADLPMGRWLAASVVHKGKIYVMGGIVDGEGISASVITYDATADAWETAPSLPEPCHLGRACMFDGHISIVTNGRRFEYTNAAWLQVTGAPVHVRSAAPCVWGD